MGHTNSTDADFKVSCKNLVMATGLPVTKVPKFRGMELAESYSDVSVDPALFANKSVLIIGRGNAAFELANNLSGVASHLHIIGRSKQRFAWQTVRPSPPMPSGRQHRYFIALPIQQP